MNTTKLKKEICKLIGCAAAFLLMILFCAAVEGTLPILAVLALGAICLGVLNSVCGMLMQPHSSRACAQPAPRPVRGAQPVSLRVVRGGRAA